MNQSHGLHVVSADRTRIELRQDFPFKSSLIRSILCAIFAFLITALAVISGSNTKTFTCEPERNERRTYACTLTRSRIGSERSLGTVRNVEGLASYSDNLGVMELAEQDYSVEIRFPADIAEQFATARRENQPLTLVEKSPLQPPLVIGLFSLPLWYLAIRALMRKGTWLILDREEGSACYRIEGTWRTKADCIELEDVSEFKLRGQFAVQSGNKTLNAVLAVDMLIKNKIFPITIGTVQGKSRDFIHIGDYTLELVQQLNKWLNPTQRRPASANTYEVPRGFDDD